MTDTNRFAIVNDVKTSHKAIAVCEVWTYDVWGNAKDGYQVNDRSCLARAARLPVRMYVSNVPSHPGASDPYRSFPADSGSFTVSVVAAFVIEDKTIRDTFGVKCAISVDGDDMRYDVSRERDERPIGEILIDHFEAWTELD